MKDKVKQDLAKGITKSFYNSAEWKAKRLDILVRDNFECQRCKGLWKGKGKPVDKAELKTDEDSKLEVHHIVELKDNPSLALVDENLITLCHHCHDEQHGRVTKRFNANKRKISKIDEKW